MKMFWTVPMLLGFLALLTSPIAVCQAADTAPGGYFYGHEGTGSLTMMISRPILIPQPWPNSRMPGTCTYSAAGTIWFRTSTTRSSPAAMGIFPQAQNGNTIWERRRQPPLLQRRMDAL